MCVNDKFHYKEWLDLDVFEKQFIESTFCEVAINRKFNIFLSEIYRVPNTSEKNEIFVKKMGFVNSLNYSMIILGTEIMPYMMIMLWVLIILFFILSVC